MQTETEKKRIGIVGYYGASPLMTAANLEKMADECLEIIVQDFGLKLSDCVLVANGATWANHVPLVLRNRHPEDVTIEFVMGARWDHTHRRFQKRGMGQSLNQSHYLMKQRLAIPLSFATLKDIAAAVEAGAEIKFEDSAATRNNTIRGLCDYLIYMPLEEDDDNNLSRFGGGIFNGIRQSSRKRLVCLKDILE